MVKQQRKNNKDTAPRGVRKPKEKTKKKKRQNNLVRRILLWIGLCFILILGALLFYLRGNNPGALGIDVSHHQGAIDWAAVSQSGQIDFVYIKASEGLSLNDDQYKRNVQEARAQGLAIGAYHFFRSNADGVRQFEHFRQIAGRSFDLIPMLDLEADGGTIRDKAEYHRQVEAFVQCCEREYGTPPILYSGISFWQDYVQPAASWCRYWAAWYPTQKTETGLRGMLQQLRGRIISWFTGWSGRQKVFDLTHPQLDAIMWQYTDKGSIPGIPGPVDMDECWDIESLRWKQHKK